MTPTEKLISEIEALRKKRGLTQQQAAEAAGYSRTAWCYMVNGQRVPPLDTLAKSVEALNADLNIKIKPRKN